MNGTRYDVAITKLYFNLYESQVELHRAEGKIVSHETWKLQWSDSRYWARLIAIVIIFIIYQENFMIKTEISHFIHKNFLLNNL